MHIFPGLPNVTEHVFGSEQISDLAINGVKHDEIMKHVISKAEGCELK